MTTLEQVKAWNWLMNQLDKIQDKNLRLAAREDFKRRALKDWGWVPGETSATETDDDYEPELSDWEQDFLRRVRLGAKLGIMVEPEKAKAEQAEARRNMLDFIRNGGLLIDIPEDIRTPDIEALYHEMWQYYAQEFEIPEYLLNTPTPPNNNPDPFGGKEPTVEQMTEWLKQGGFYLNLPRGVRNSKTYKVYQQALDNLS